jgi:hypothetical protein
MTYENHLFLFLALTLELRVLFVQPPDIRMVPILHFLSQNLYLSQYHVHCTNQTFFSGTDFRMYVKQPKSSFLQHLIDCLPLVSLLVLDLKRPIGDRGLLGGFFNLLLFLQGCRGRCALVVASIVVLFLERIL